jgi:hypothetical protein
MNIRVMTRPMQAAIVAALVAASAWTLPVRAQQDDHQHAQMAQKPLTPEQQRRANVLLSQVRDATFLFQTPDTLPQGYKLLFGCVSGDSNEGAMGLHYVNTDLVFDGGVLNVMTPEIVLYEPLPGGKIKITGADYVIMKADWDGDPQHPRDPPQLFGQLFHLITAPNRFGLDAFYTLHVWAWKDNPNGPFTNWNPTVSCENFNGHN